MRWPSRGHADRRWFLALPSAIASPLSIPLHYRMSEAIGRVRPYLLYALDMLHITDGCLAEGVAFGDAQWVGWGEGNSAAMVDYDDAVRGEEAAGDDACEEALVEAIAEGRVDEYEGVGGAGVLNVSFGGKEADGVSGRRDVEGAHGAPHFGDDGGVAIAEGAGGGAAGERLNGKGAAAGE